MTYGPNSSKFFRRLAVYVKKIVSGEKPSEIPIEQPSTFELVINLKTAKSIGLTIPPTLLAPRRRGDRVRGRAPNIAVNTARAAELPARRAAPSA